MTDADLDALFARWVMTPPTDAEMEAALGGYVNQPPTPAPPSWLTVDGSSNVAAVIFWPDPRGGTRGRLGMRFHNGGEYHYLMVEDYVFRALCSARSKGSTHWDLIRRKGYDFVCITKPRKNWRRTKP